MAYELSKDVKLRMIDRRMQEYQAKLFQLELDQAALTAVDDTAGIAQLEDRRAALLKACDAVQVLKSEIEGGESGADTEPTSN